MENIIEQMWDKAFTEDFKSGLISLDVFLDKFKNNMYIELGEFDLIEQLNVGKYTDLSDIIADINVYENFIIPLYADEINTSEGISLIPILYYAQDIFDEEVIYDNDKKEFFYNN